MAPNGKAGYKHIHMKITNQAKLYTGKDANTQQLIAPQSLVL